MFQIKVTNNDNSERVLSFKEFTRTVVLAKYGQLISEGEIKDFQLVWVSVVSARIKSINQKERRSEMNRYEVRVYNRRDGQEIMRSELFATMSEAEEVQRNVGQGEGYFSVLMDVESTWEELFSRLGVTA